METHKLATIGLIALALLALGCAPVAQPAPAPTAAPAPTNTTVPATTTNAPPAATNTPPAPTATNPPTVTNTTQAATTTNPPPSATNTTAPATATSTPVPPTATSAAAVVVSADKLTGLELTPDQVKSIFGAKQTRQAATKLTDVTQVYPPKLSEIIQKDQANMLFDAWAVERGQCTKGTPCTLLVAAFAFKNAEDAKAWNDILDAQGNGLEQPQPLTLTSAKYWDDASPNQNVTGTRPASGNTPAMKAIYVGLRKANVVLGMNLQGLDYDSAAVTKVVDAIVSQWADTLKADGLQ